MTEAIDREASDKIIAELISPEGNKSPDVKRATLGILATLLRQDRLLKSGRDFLADYLMSVASGADPRSLLPKAHYSAKGKTSLAVFVAVENDKAKRNLHRADTDLYCRVGIRMKLGPDTVKTRASVARAHVKRVLAREIESGIDREKLVKVTAKALRLPEAAVRALMP